MVITKIEFIETKPVRIQVNNLKKTLIETEIILGRKFTLEMATLILQIEKLIYYYDSKKMSSRFNSNFRALELTISSEEVSLSEDLSELINKLNSIKTAFHSAGTNERKKCIMFELLFLHINILFNAYQNQESKMNNSVMEELETNNSAENLTNNSNDGLEKLTDKQRKKYIELTNQLKNAEPSQRNKIQAGRAYYKRLMRE